MNTTTDSQSSGARRGCLRWAAIILGGLAALVVVLAAVVWIAGARSAQQPDFDEIDRFVESQMSAHRIPGLALAITQGDEVVHTRGFGTAGSGRDMTPQTPLYIGSVSKSFTALAVMRLVEQGKIDLDAPVQEYIPWFQVADPEASRRITVRHLLNHTSGLSDLGYAEDLPDDATLEDAVRQLRNAVPTKPVGTTEQYFNQNYTTLGLIVERVSGQPYDEYIQEHIFDPLEMNRTTTSPEKASQAGVAQGHSLILGFPLARKTSQPQHEYDVPSGGIISTAEDMAHFLIAQNNGGRYAGGQILSVEGVEAMHRPNTEIGSTYAMGWRAKERDGIRMIHHGGDLPGFHADAILLPEQGYGAILLMNVNDLLFALTGGDSLRLGVVDLLAGKEPTTGLALSTIYLILAVVIIVDVVRTARSLLALPKWREEIQGQPIGKLIPGIAMDFILPLVLFFGLPILLNAVVPDLRFSWQYAFEYAITLMAWLSFAIFASLVRGIAKVWILVRHRRPAPAGLPELEETQ